MMYRKVNIFNWYQPKNKLFGVASPYEYEETKLFQSWIDKGYQNKYRKFKGYRPYKVLEQAITPSSIVQQPVSIDLLNLSNSIQTILKSDGVLRMIQYMAPQFQSNSLVSKFLVDLKKDKAKIPKSTFLQKDNLTLNSAFSSNINADQFAKLTFTLAQSSNEQKKKPIGFTIKPHSIQIQSAIFLGSKRLSTYSYSQPRQITDKVIFSKSTDQMTFQKPIRKSSLWTQFEPNIDMLLEEQNGNLICIQDLPSHARICINIILLADVPTIQNQKSKSKGIGSYTKMQGFVLGSCQVSLFDESYLLRQGLRELRLWPFQSFDPRMVCQGKCFNKFQESDALSLLVEFPSFQGRVGWRLGGKYSSSINKTNLNRKKTLKRNNSSAKDIRQIEDTYQQHNLDQETESLKHVKKLLDAYPLELDQEDMENIDVETVLKYKNYIQKLPILIKLIDFLDHSKIRICYDSLELSGKAKETSPEEALALLDGQFGDIKVRIFAVKKLSQLTDSQIALFMPQLIQALKYELFHQSPLSEFLLEKALNNTRVVGHPFFWNLKANLSKESSRERFYLMLERFLMCCGQFKNELFKQNLVNESLIKLSQFVNHKLDVEKVSKKQTVALMHKQLHREEIKIKIFQQLVIDHAKYDDLDLVHINEERQSSNISRSKKTFSSVSSFDQANLSCTSEEDLYQVPNEEVSLQELLKNSGSLKQKHLRHNSGNADEKRQKYTFRIQEIIALIDENLENLLLDESTQDNRLRILKYKLKPLLWQKELLIIPFAPKYPLSSFSSTGCNIFLSKKKPLLISAVLADQQATEDALRSYHSQVLRPQSQKQNEEEQEQRHEKPQMIKFLFKCGDDLKQDNLVLQFFKIMDRLWQTSSLELNMICYDVLETGFETGYIEYIDEATVITQMHKDYNFFSGPFSRQSVMQYFMNNQAKLPMFTQAPSKIECQNRLKNYHKTFLSSLAGQCVATYVLGIRDRHPGNFMLHNPTGKFFHIDFGHFLDHCKQKNGFKRDREPFIYSKELQYFLRHFNQIVVQQVSQSNTPLMRRGSRFMRTSQVPIDKTQQIEENSQIEPLKKKNTQTSEQAFEKFKLVIDQKFQQQQTESTDARSSADYFEDMFENLASKAFLKLRQNADIFINLLILMLVSGLEELDMKSIGFLKQVLFLDVSEEEATVFFKQVIEEARNQWYRPYDNLFHVISDFKKERKRRVQESAAQRAE